VIPLADAVAARARRVGFWRTVLTVATAVLFGLGWAVAKAFAVVWLAVTWTGAAVALGWQEARGTRTRPSRDDLVADNERLRTELKRLS
jgi:hypothetical protein